MNILIAARSFYPNFGGVESSIEYISRAFREKGHKVTILTSLLYKNQSVEEKFGDGIKILRIPIKGQGLKDINIVETMILPQILLIEYRRYLAKMDDKFDLIITRDTVFTELLVAKFGIQKVIYIPAVVIKNYRWNIKLGSIRQMFGEIIMYIQLSLDWRIQKKCLEKYRTVVFSKNMKSQIKRMLRVRFEPVVAYPGTKYKIKKIDFCENKKEKCRFIYVGRVDTEKNVDFLIRSFAKCKLIGKAELTIVGTGNCLNKTKRSVESLNLQNSIYFVGKQSKLSDYYSNADYLVLPTKYEAFGFVIAEAQTFGVPVIGFENNGEDVLVAVDEIITDYQNGFVCKEYSEESLAKTIDIATKVYYTDKYHEMVKESIKTAQNKFRWDKFVEKIEKG